MSILAERVERSREREVRYTPASNTGVLHGPGGRPRILAYLPEFPAW
jgi:hypothetical protein